MTISTRSIVVAGALIAISAVLSLTGLGYFPVPNVTASATILHVPPIIGAVLEGPAVGMLVGLVFGVDSLVKFASVVLSAPAYAAAPLWQGWLAAIVIILACCLAGLSSAASRQPDRGPCRSRCGRLAGQFCVGARVCHRAAGLFSRCADRRHPADCLRSGAVSGYHSGCSGSLAPPGQRARRIVGLSRARCLKPSWSALPENGRAGRRQPQAVPATHCALPRRPGRAGCLGAPRAAPD
jgi:ECF transporter, substrate-specific component